MNNKKKNHIEKLAIGLYKKYNLGYQFDSSLKDDIKQSALLEYLEAEKNNKWLGQAVWRGVHNQIRLMIYGRYAKRTHRAEFVPLLEDEHINNILEDKVDWWRAAEKMNKDSIEYKYFVEDKSLKSIGIDYNLSESRICQKVKKWVKLYA